MLALIGLSNANAQVGIGTTDPDPSAKLEVNSANNDKGFLPPRMSTTDRDNIAGATAGLVIYNTTTNTLQFSDGTNWVDLADNSTTGVSGTEPAGNGDVGIGTPTPNVNAVLDVESTTQGFLPPRLTTAERNVLPSPAEGLVIFNTDRSTLEFCDGTNWIDLSNNTIVASPNTAPATTAGNVGVGTTTPDSSAALDLEANDKGFLPPRMTDAQRDAIAEPAEGLVIFNTDAKCLEFFDASFWVNQCTGEVSAVDNANLTVANPTYQGPSPIDSRGVGYNAEAVPAASTITVELSNSSADAQNYALLATDPATGLEYSASGNIAGNATGVAVVLTSNEQMMDEDFFGTITMPLEGTSSTLDLEPRIDIKSIPANETVVNAVSNPNTGQKWMDRNLGARQVATASDDGLSYGNLYQWGRGSDGHEIIVLDGDNPSTVREGLNGTTSTLATSANPGHSDFVTVDASPNDWLATPDDNLWQGAGGVNNPCPSGYRLPTEAELTEEHDDFSTDNAAGAFASPLKLPVAGRRNRDTGAIILDGVTGNYWSSTVGGSNARRLHFTSSIALLISNDRAFGFSVRCIKD